MTKRLVDGFPLWAVLFALVAYFEPHLFAGLKFLIEPLLGIVMLGMGMTLLAEDFLRVFKKPFAIVLGTCLQFLVMPFVGWSLAKMAGLNPALAAGVVLVGACPGGTASNVITYLAKGDVALSISLTAVSTLLSVLLTPWLTWFYVGTLVTVPIMQMILSIFKIVVIPVAAGLWINQRFGSKLAKVKDGFPLISVIAIVFIIAIVVSLNQSHMQGAIWPVVGVVLAHNVLGLAGGYGFARLFRIDEKVARTISIEVGMQNSGLGVALAARYFSSLAALPGVVFSIWHNLSGSCLAAVWSRRPIKS